MKTHRLSPVLALLLATPLSAATLTWNKNTPLSSGQYQFADPAHWGTGTGDSPNPGDTVHLDIALLGVISINFNAFGPGNKAAYAGELYLGDASGNNHNIQFTGGGSNRTLTIGNPSGPAGIHKSTGNNHTIQFTGGGSGRTLTIGNPSGPAGIYKSTGNTVTFNRGVAFTSAAVISSTGGDLRFQSGVSGAVPISFEGTGGTVTLATAATTGNLTGDATIRNGGTLLVEGTLQSAGSATLTVETSGTLGGDGTLARAVTVESGGRLSPGRDGADLLTFTSGLTLETGSIVAFDLLADTTSGRGSAFDAVDFTGGPLTIEAGATFNLQFNAAGSTVDFTSAFWQEDREWLVFSGGEPADVLSPMIFTLGSLSTDAFGNTLNHGAFSFRQQDNAIYLTFAAIPEPASTLLLGAGLLLGAFSQRRTIFSRFRREDCMNPPTSADGHS